MYSYLDELPDKVQKAIYYTFKSASLPEKIVLLTRLQYGYDPSYKRRRREIESGEDMSTAGASFQELSQLTGVTMQRVQQMYDTMFEKIKRKTHVHASGFIMMSGVYV